MCKRILLIIGLFVIIAFIFYYIKLNILYDPHPVNTLKYKKFYKNILKLTENQSNIVKTFVETEDGILLDTLYLKNPDTSKCIIFFHGNSGNISMRYDMVKFLYTYSSVLIFDYRSYGKSSGNKIEISSSHLKKDIDAIWIYATQQLNIKPSTICLFGESLGCSLAIYLACKLSKTHDIRNYPHSLVLNSPFFSITSLATYLFNKNNLHLFGTILSYFIKHEYTSNEWIPYINQHTSILIAHSHNDEIIPYTEGEKLYNLISRTHKNSKFVNIVGTHNNLGLTNEYIYTLADMLKDKVESYN